MSDLYLSRARLGTGRGRLGPILFPEDPAHRMAVSHRLVWTLFPPELRQRPFLYRETSLSHRAAKGGEFYILSSIAPQDREGLFELETRPFAPMLRRNEILRFSLRANPTAQRSETVDGRRKSRRHDVVMRALRPVASKDRAAERPKLIRSAGLVWLTQQGERAGFVLPDPDNLAIDGYEQFDADPEGRLDRKASRRPVHSRLDYEGLLRIEDPDLFLARLAIGFGRARAFGHGLMLIRRA
jgi:CRISPR system Cascade subunit CasE